MKSIVTIALFLANLIAWAQVNNAKTVEVSINGNCKMCQATIEKVANKAGEAELLWDMKTKKAQLTYDSSKTTPKAVLKRVALAGYDNQYYRASDETYSELPGCCQYERKDKSGKDKAVSKKSCDKASCAESKEKKACCSDKADSCKMKNAEAKD